MSDDKVLNLVRNVSSPTRGTADDEFMRMRGTRDGSLFTADWYMAHVLEGKVYGVNSGTGGSPTTLNAAYAAAEQDLYIYVPSGTTIIPIYLSVCFEDTGTAAVIDCCAAISTTSDASVTGTALTPVNMNTGVSTSSGCTVSAVVTAGGTDPTSAGYLEFWRPYAGFSEDGFNGSTAFGNPAVHGAKWCATDTCVPPVIKGTGSLSLYAGAQAGTAFLTAIWIELTSSQLCD